MISKSSALQKAQSVLGSDCQTCRMRVAAGSGEEDCLMEVIRSQWREPFGDSSYCSHPDARQVVDFINLDLP